MDKGARVRVVHRSMSLAVFNLFIVTVAINDERDGYCIDIAKGVKVVQRRHKLQWFYNRLRIVLDL